jgi:hypothetical protein
MIRQKNFLSGKGRQRVSIEVIGMTVGRPDVVALPDMPKLLLRDVEAHAPTAKIRGTANPRIGDENRFAIEANERRVSDGFKAQHRAKGSPNLRKIVHLTSHIGNGNLTSGERRSTPHPL